MKQKIEHYKVCSKCGAEKNIFSVLTRCTSGGAHVFNTSRTRWVDK